MSWTISELCIDAHPFLLQVPCATKARMGEGGNERIVELVKRQD